MAGTRNYKGQSRIQHSALLLIQKGCLVGVGLMQDAAFDFFIARDPLPSQMFHCATMLNYVVFYMCLKGLRTQRKGLAQGAALPLRVFWSRPARINAKSCNICQFSRECARILPECQEDLPLAWILEDLRSPQHRWRLLRTPRWWPN